MAKAKINDRKKENEKLMQELDSDNICYLLIYCKAELRKRSLVTDISKDITSSLDQLITLVIKLGNHKDLKIPIKKELKIVLTELRSISMLNQIIK